MDTECIFRHEGLRTRREESMGSMVRAARDQGSSRYSRVDIGGSKVFCFDIRTIGSEPLDTSGPYLDDIRLDTPTSRGFGTPGLGTRRFDVPVLGVRSLRSSVLGAGVLRSSTLGPVRQVFRPGGCCTQVLHPGARQTGLPSWR